MCVFVLLMTNDFFVHCMTASAIKDTIHDMIRARYFYGYAHIHFADGFVCMPCSHERA